MSLIRWEPFGEVDAFFNRLVPSSGNRPLTQAQLDSLLKFARCMRSHGISDWPDPSSDGSFPLDSRLTHTLKSAIRSQLMARGRTGATSTTSPRRGSRFGAPPPSWRWRRRRRLPGYSRGA